MTVRVDTYNGRLPAHPIIRFVIFAFAAVVGINIGGALLASVVIFPVWSASPEAAAAWNGVVNEARFFVVVSPLALLLAIVTGIASWWAEAPLRKWMRLSAVLFIAFFVITIAYFVPGQARLKGEAGAVLPQAELAAQLQTWVTLNWGRQALGVIAFGAALHAVGLSYRHRKEEE